MYICPVCQKGFNAENKVVKHYLSCWKYHNPNHKSIPAPHSEDIIKVEIDNDTLKFFESFGK